MGDMLAAKPEISKPKPLPFPFITIPGLANFRDIGGWPITDDNGRTIAYVRKGILYRGPDTNKITPEGEKLLQELGIVVDFDLRSKQQIEKTGGIKNLEGVQRVWTPVFKEEEYTEEAAAKRYEQYASDGTEGITTAFLEVLTSGASTFATILRHILSTAPSTALFIHCTTGNNRSGVFIGVLLSLLGVPPSAIADEYALSENGLAATRHLNVERLLKKGAFREYGDQARARCERMVGARRESMLALIERVGVEWGGAEGYVRGPVGLSEEELGRLKGVLTVRVGEEDGEEAVAGAQEDVESGGKE